MAKILLGPTVIGIRGTVAGITFSQNGGGPYARAWHKPANPNTTPQRTAQQSLVVWSKLWRDVSAANQALWATYAAAPAQDLQDSLGQPYSASGFNWYVTINKARALMSLAATATPPVAAAPAAPTVDNFVFRITSIAATTRIQYNAASPTLALYKVIYAQVVNSFGITVRPKTRFFMKASTVNASNQIAFKTEQTAKFGTIELGQRMFVETFNLSAEGRYGPSVYKSANAQNT